MRRAEAIIKQQGEELEKYISENSTLAAILEHQEKTLATLEFECKATQTMCNSVKVSC